MTDVPTEVINNHELAEEPLLVKTDWANHLTPNEVETLQRKKN